MRFGIIINDTSFSQLTLQLADSRSQLKNVAQHVDCTLFTLATRQNVIDLQYAILPAKYAWHYQGPLIATSLDTARILLKCKGTNQKYWYMWDNEWMQDVHSVLDIEPVYMNKDLRILARSEDMYEIFKKTWREPYDIVGEFDYAELIRSITKV